MDAIQERTQDQERLGIRAGGDAGARRASGAGARPGFVDDALAGVPTGVLYGRDEVCIASVRRVMDVFGGKWAFLVLEQLHVGTMRFGDLRRALGVSTKSLTDTLRRFEEHGIVERRAYPTVPVTVEYSLTDKGRSFDSVLNAMKEWGRAWL